MGRYCVCGVKITGIEIDPEKCKCDWEGWITIDENKKLRDPEENGTYLVRYINNGGDCFEGLMKFSKEPLRIETGYFGNKIPIYWSETSWDDNCVYAWKEKLTGERIDDASSN